MSSGPNSPDALSAPFAAGGTPGENGGAPKTALMRLIVFFQGFVLFSLMDSIAKAVEEAVANARNFAALEGDDTPRAIARKLLIAAKRRKVSDPALALALMAKAEEIERG